MKLIFCLKRITSKSCIKIKNI